MKHIILLISLIMIFSACKEQTESADDRTRLAVSWELIRNYSQGGHQARFVLTNTSQNTLDDNWELYWNMAPRTVDQGSITAPVEISWINGDYYVMKPAAGFSLAPGEKLEVVYQAEAFMIKESDGPLGLFMVQTENGQDLITELTDYDIIPFQKPEQIDRMEGDEEPIPTPEHLYDQQAGLTALDDSEIPLIMPTPRKLKTGEGVFSLTGETTIDYPEDLSGDGMFLLNALSKLGITSSREEGNPANGIRLTYQEQEIPGSYSLRVTGSQGVDITGDTDGIFYGIQSLLSLIPAENLGHENDRIEIPEIEIYDSPAFQYRGFFLDISRNFNSPQAVSRYLV